MAAEKGRGFVLQASVSGTYTTIGGLTANTMTINNEPVDVTNKSSNGYRTLLANAGTRSLELSANGIFDDDAAFRLIRQAADANTHLTLRMVFESGDVVEGSFMVQSLQFSGNNGEAVNYQLTLQSAGSWTYTG